MTRVCGYCAVGAVAGLTVALAGMYALLMYGPDCDIFLEV